MFRKTRIALLLTVSLMSYFLCSCTVLDPGKLASDLGVETEDAAQLTDSLPNSPIQKYAVMRKAEKEYGKFLRTTSAGTFALLTPDKRSYFVLEPGHINRISKDELGHYSTANFILNHRRDKPYTTLPTYLAVKIIRMFVPGSYPSQRVVSLRNSDLRNSDWFDRETCLPSQPYRPKEVAANPAEFEDMHKFGRDTATSRILREKWHATSLECTAGDLLSDSWQYRKPWQDVIDDGSFQDMKVALGLRPEAALDYSVEARLIRFEETTDSRSASPLIFGVSKPFSHEAFVISVSSPIDEAIYTGTYYIKFEEE